MKLYRTISPPPHNKGGNIHSINKVGTVSGGMKLKTRFKDNSTVDLHIIKGKRDTDGDIIITSAEIR